jgi:tetratricopeptide (TPR) repeat protein
MSILAAVARSWGEAMVGRQALRQIPRFKGFSDSDLDLILQRLVRRKYRPGEVILHYGARGDFMAIVARGEIEIVAPVWRNYRRLATLQTGDFFGAASLQNGAAASATLRALTPTELWLLRKKDFEELRPRRAVLPTVISFSTLLAPLKRLPHPLVGVFLSLFLLILSGIVVSSWPVRYMRATVYYALGNRHLEKENPGEAVRYFEKSLSLGVKQAAVHNNAGYAYHRQGRLADAIGAFSTAIELDPSTGAAHNNLGVLYHKSGRFDEAVSSLLRATRLEPNNAQLHHNLGLAYHAQGNLIEAARQYREALRIAPGLAPSHCNLGSIYFSQGNLTDATVEFQRALQTESEMSIAHGGLGAIYYEQGDLDKALSHFARAVDVEPDYAVGHFYLALIYEANGQQAEAERAFKRVVLAQGDSKVTEQAWEHLKQLWRLKGEIE